MSEAGSIPYALPGGQLTRKDLVRIAKDLSATKGASTSLLELTSHWLQIIAAFGLYYLFPAWWTAIALFIFIGARQYAILIMLHEAQHTLLHPNKRINNAIATWLIAAPCGTIFENSQKTHLAHHFNLGDEHRDPAFYIYCTGRPTPKKLLGDFVRFYLSRIGGQKIWALIMGETKHLASPPEKRDKATVLKEAFRKVGQSLRSSCLSLAY